MLGSFDPDVLRYPLNWRESWPPGAGPGAGGSTPERGRARVAALLGDREAAVELLRRAFGEGLPYGIWIHLDRDLEPLSGYLPFQELIRPKD